MSLLKKVSVTLIAAIFLMTAVNISFAGNGKIKIGLAQNITKVKLSSPAPLKITDSTGKKVKLRSPMVAQITGKRISIRGKAMVAPLRIYSKKPISFKGKRYLGSFHILLKKNRMVLVNEIKLENYLRGVLKMEVNPSWPMEALKAQAIISRTYALRHMGKHSAMGYDLCSNTHCQAYRGINAHNRITDKAIKATKGIILTYKGKPASTFFHSDSGGRTAASESVWGGYIPYLRSVKEATAYECPYSNWQLKLSSKKIKDSLSRKKIYIGEITGLNVKRRDSSGRVALIEITGSRGKKQMSGNAFRMAIGSRTLKSTMFKVRKDSFPTKYKKGPVNAKSSWTSKGTGDLTAEEETQLLILTKQGIFSPEEIIDMLSNPHNRKKYLSKEQRKIPSPEKNQFATIPTYSGNFVLTGHGWGHGVGLSQWGARALAIKGWNAKRILYNYYPGTKIVRMR